MRNTVSIVGMKEETDRDQQDDSRELMYTGDPYKGMEVRIIAGEAKMHTGVVLDTRQVEGEYDILLIVRTTSRTINNVMHLSINDVNELQ
jgi:hypothetical protein